MKLFKKTLLFLSFVSFGFAGLEAKSIELFLDHKTKETFDLQEEIPSFNQETPANLSYFKQLTVENIGDRPIRNCFPRSGPLTALSLEELAEKIGQGPYPLLSLYQMWKQSIICRESAEKSQDHPLDLLNFRGVCSAKSFQEQFLKLCFALGIETRCANVHGKTVYDFGLDNEWNFLDLVNNQVYLTLNNEKLASSDDVMDDPFLALRAKHGRPTSSIDFKESWKQLAAFDILDPQSAPSEDIKCKKLGIRAHGVTLYPGEKLTFETNVDQPDVTPYQCMITQTIQLDGRPFGRHWKHLSAYPLHRLINDTEFPIRLVNQEIDLQPGEAFTFSEPVFNVHVAFSEKPQGKITLSGMGSWALFPKINKGKNEIALGSKKNQTILRFKYEINDKFEKTTLISPTILNKEAIFDHTSPEFSIDCAGIDQIWWQIGFDEQFELIPSNFDQVERANSTISLPLISETFLNSETNYYFRVKGYRDGQWSEWSAPFKFQVKKPATVDVVIFEEVKEGVYELNWERYAEKTDDSIEYLIFGSNALDFIPSIYSPKQINEIVGNQVTEEEVNDNLIAVTKKTKIRIGTNYAYYRIVARKNGQLSVPSPIIRVYDTDFVQPRNVLQLINEGSEFVAKRTLFPLSSPWSKSSLPLAGKPSKFEKGIIKLQSLIRSVEPINSKKKYEKPDLPEEVWEEVRVYLLPDNHPAWPKLNRIFCRARVTQSPEHFKRAGFRRWQPGRWSRVSASSHPEIPEYFIKAYCDVELGIIYDWRKWIHRIKGAETIRRCIEANDMHQDFKVPNKWIYPLPKNPSPPKGAKYIRKNFILVCENMGILEHRDNEHKYKHISADRMLGLYKILQICGLYDSVYVFNMPFCKDGKIAIIDTEYHHRWPVPFDKLTKYFPKELQSYWKQLTYRGGRIPDGKNEYNPPRMDRRDVPLKKK